MGTNYQNLFYKDYEQLYERNSELIKELRQSYYDNELLKQRCEAAEKENERLKCILGIDGSNSGVPTSKTPLDKDKIIPNSRKPSERPRGGQKGHKKHKLERFEDSEINDRVEHILKECPQCHKELEKRGTIEKDVLDYKIIVKKTRHIFAVYRCAC